MTSSISVGGVHVDLGLNSAKFNSGLKRTGTELDRFGSKTKGAAAMVSSSMARAGAAMVTKFIAPLAALGAAGIVTQVGQVAKGIAQIGDEAARAGLSVDVFQEMAAVARAARVPVDALVDGVKELNLRGDEFIVTGAGSAADSFKRLGYTADELKEKLKDPSALFTEIIGKLGQLDKAAQIRVADELFGGTGGEKFVQLIAQGEAGIRSTIQTARDLGQVMDAQVIAKANDLDVAFGQVADTVGSRLQQSIVSASWALFDFLQQFKAMEDRTTTSLDNRLYDLGRDIVFKDRERLQAQSDAKSNPWNAGLHNGFAAQLEREIADLRAEEARILKVLEDRKAPIAAPVASIVPTVPTTGTGGRSASNIVAEADAVLRQIEALRWEKDAIGLTAKELAVANALRQAGSVATAEQRLEIESLVTSTLDAQMANDRMNASLEQMSQLGQDALSGFIDDLIAGKDAGEAFGNVLGNIGSQLIKMGIGSLGNMIFPGLGSAGVSLFKDGGTTGPAGFKNIEVFA